MRGFATLYCQGRRQNECVRKKLCAELGSPAAVPVNMMPNGKPLFGSSNEEWEDRVFDALDVLNVSYFRKKKFTLMRQRAGFHY